MAFDVAIIGAGPAGCTAAIALHQSGLKVALIDKATFPRDKICGDALSPDVVNQLGKLPLDTADRFNKMEEKIWCKAVRFVSPDYSQADVSLSNTGLMGYVSPRLDFDAVMYEQAMKSDCVTAFMGKSIETISSCQESILIDIKGGEQIKAKMILGADGANSAVARALSAEKTDKNHHCAGLRQYYSNVTGFSDDNAVELHFYDELLPGYFWIFPLPGNRANVGLGMLSAVVAKKKPNLKKLLKEIIETHPNVKDRFTNATPLEEIKGFGLPLGSKKRSISGNRYLLLGDAASLINPLSGEGIGNAIRSGRVAADHVKMAFEKKTFDAKFNKAYDKEIYGRMWGELRLNYWVQVVMRNRRLCNFVVKKALSSPVIQELIMSGFNAHNLTLLLFGKTKSKK